MVGIVMGLVFLVFGAVLDLGLKFRFPTWLVYSWCAAAGIIMAAGVMLEKIGW